MSAPIELVHWTDPDGQAQQARWRSLAGHAPPKKVQLADDRINADLAYRLVCEGTGLLWCGDYQNARHLLLALGRRIDDREHRASVAAATAAAKASGAPASAKRRGKAAPASPFNRPADPTSPALPAPAQLALAFHLQRKAQAQRARILGLLLLPFDADHGVPLRRAPDLRQAGLQAHGPAAEHYVASLRELQGVVGAFEWRKNGVPIAALEASIHPHHGVFSPLRGEYVDLVATTALPTVAHHQGAFDIGTGSGVLAAVLARRKLRVTATDTSPTALACAADNLQRLDLTAAVKLLQADLFPPGRAGLVLCNPPWVPAQPSSVLDAAVYDPDSRMLKGFLAGLREHLAPGGEGWLILSDLAEHLGLRPRSELMGWIGQAGLTVLGRVDAKPLHARAADKSDPLHAARAAETTSLWRLAAG